MYRILIKAYEGVSLKYLDVSRCSIDQDAKLTVQHKRKCQSLAEIRQLARCLQVPFARHQTLQSYRL